MWQVSFIKGQRHAPLKHGLFLSVLFVTTFGCKKNISTFQAFIKPFPDIPGPGPAVCAFHFSTTFLTEHFLHSLEGWAGLQF